jgi:RNA polymerase sigma factor (sigma-70 family)
MTLRVSISVAIPRAWWRLWTTPTSASPSALPPAIDAVVAGLHHDEAQALFGFVRRLGLSNEQADDAVQEVFARLLDTSRQGIAVANPRSWAFQTIYRIAMDQYRLRRRIVGLVESLRRRDVRPSSEAADRIAVWHEVDRLPERQRTVIYLRYRADLPFDEIGQVMGISASAARSHAAQATATLRARLADPVHSIEEMP